jgi:hypothetical protein
MPDDFTCQGEERCDSMLKLVYTKHFMMFGHSGGALWQFENSYTFSKHLTGICSCCENGLRQIPPNYIKIIKFSLSTN